jgi:hypothetical protein
MRDQSWAGGLTVLGLSVFKVDMTKYQHRITTRLGPAFSMDSCDSPITEPLSCLRKLSQLVPHHLVRHGHGDIVHEPEADEGGQDRGRSALGEDRGVVFQGVSKVGKGGEEGSCRVSHNEKVSSSSRLQSDEQTCLSMRTC